MFQFYKYLLIYNNKHEQKLFGVCSSFSECKVVLRPESLRTARQILSEKPKVAQYFHLMKYNRAETWVFTLRIIFCYLVGWS